MKKKKNTDNEVDDENDKKVIRRTLRLEARVTEQEYAKAAELAKTLRFVHEQLCAPHYFRAAPTATAV